METTGVKGVDASLSTLEEIFNEILKDCKGSYEKFFCNYEDMKQRLEDYSDIIKKLNYAVMRCFEKVWTDVYEKNVLCNNVFQLMDLIKDKVMPHDTRFEKARIIGARALQISCGAPVMIDYPHNMLDPVDIAILEYDNRVIPITVKRD